MKRDAGGRGLAAVAEDHRLDVDGGAPVVGDAVQLAVGLRALVVPGLEDGADRSPELLLRVVGEAPGPSACGRSPRSASTTSARSFGGQLGVGCDAPRACASRSGPSRTPRRGSAARRRRTSGGTGAGSRARSARPTAPRRALSVCDVRPRFRIVSIMPGIEDARARPDRDEQRVGRVAESPARRVLEPAGAPRRPRASGRRGAHARVRRRCTRTSSIVNPAAPGCRAPSSRPGPSPCRRASPCRGRRPPRRRCRTRNTLHFDLTSRRRSPEKSASRENSC